MLKNLRNRLFASYLLVLIIALVLVASVTVTTLSQREVPAEFTWNRLELLLAGFTSPQFMRDILPQVADGELTDNLMTFADQNGVRIMLVVEGNDDETRVIYDSQGAYSGNNMPQYETEDRRPPQRGNNNNNNGNNNNDGNPPPNLTESGRFFEGDTEWLYASVSRRIERGRTPIDEVTLLIAEPRSTDSVIGAVQDFNDLLLRPLLRSALIAGGIAFVLAIFLTRSITRPLQALAISAQHVGKGKFNEAVPETGPSEIQQVALAFNRMTGEVQAAQLSQREFMANVSHDLKTPLTSIQGYSQAIIDGAASDPTYAASVINEEAERLNRMVQELTDLARLQAGRLSMKLSPLDVGELVGAVGQRLSLVAAKENIDLDVQTSPLPEIAADGDRLVQVMTNLIGNAIKYTQSGGNILVQTSVRNGGVEITVQDNGRGIPTEDLPHIFDRFYQVDKSRGPQRGTGLGLAITQEILQSHGGTIDIFSEGLNQGTKVTVWLPSSTMSTIVNRRLVTE